MCFGHYPCFFHRSSLRVCLMHSLGRHPFSRTRLSIRRFCLGCGLLSARPALLCAVSFKSVRPVAGSHRSPWEPFRVIVERLLRYVRFSSVSIATVAISALLGLPPIFCGEPFFLPHLPVRWFRDCSPFPDVKGRAKYTISVICDEGSLHCRVTSSGVFPDWQNVLRASNVQSIAKILSGTPPVIKVNCVRPSLISSSNSSLI